MVMSFKNSHSKTGIGWRKFGWNSEHSQMKTKGYGTEIYVGPRGSGKSALAYFRAYQYYKGKMRNPDGFCVCGDSKCDAKWSVITNLESPTQPEYGAWCSPLDLEKNLLDLESADRHAIILIDEITQYANARRGMLGEVIKLINAATLQRKKSIRFWGTGLSFDWIDVRMREQTTHLYNCWTTNAGVSVNAMVYNLANGDLPPWARKQPPVIKTWWTQSIWNRYNHEELVNAQTDFDAVRAEQIVYIEDENGNVIEKEMSELVSDMVGLAIQSNLETITPLEISTKINELYGLPISEGYVRDWLTKMFMRDGESFILRAKQKVGQS